MSPLKYTDQTLSEQLRMTAREIHYRLQLFYFTESDVEHLKKAKRVIVPAVDELVSEFYKKQVAIEEVSRVIGDAESLTKLKVHMRRYVLALFDGQYGAEYVQTRLRIGMVHMRIGVTPKLYVSAICGLGEMLRKHLRGNPDKECLRCENWLKALDKILMFDLSLVFDTYIHSLMEELERGKNDLEKYAESLEEVVAERTGQLAELARRDGLTGLLNQRSLWEELKREVSRSQRRASEVSLLYLDIDKFKQVNDTHGHQKGDELLIQVADAVRAVLRLEDIAARYGGDEFCVILPQTSQEEAVQVARRIFEDFDKHKGDSEVFLSIGISSTGPDEFLDPDSFLKEADAAMYLAKTKTGNTIRVANRED